MELLSWFWAALALFTIINCAALSQTLVHYYPFTIDVSDAVGIRNCRPLCEGVQREYNDERPHQSLKYLIAVEFKQQWLQNLSQTIRD